MAASSTLASACALEAHEGDGLVTDGREIQVSTSVVPDAGRPDTGVSSGTTDCKQLDLFMQTVWPLLNKKSEGIPLPGEVPPGPQACLDCHDGTKPKAYAALAMEPKEPDFTCLVAVTLGAKFGETDITQSQILTSSDPKRPDKMHDFKFLQSADQERFYAGVLAWLKAEQQR